MTIAYFLFSLNKIYFMHLIGYNENSLTLAVQVYFDNMKGNECFEVMFNEEILCQCW